jgi:hypothetical protein
MIYLPALTIDAIAVISLSAFMYLSSLSSLSSSDSSKASSINSGMVTNEKTNEKTCSHSIQSSDIKYALAIRDYIESLNL